MRRVLVAALVAVGCIVALVPLAPVFPAPELDSAWMFAVNAAVAQGKVFGRDLVFTFGPYAALYTWSFHPATDRLAMAAGPVLAAAVAAGLTLAAPGRWAAVLLALLLSLPVLRDPVFFIIPLVFLAAVARLREPRWPGVAVGALLVVALALLPLIKGTFAAGSAMGLGLGVALLLWRRRGGLAGGAILLFAVAMAGFWRLAHQPLRALPGFFLAQSRIVDGYTDAMSLPGPAWQVALFAGLAAAVLALNLRPAARAGLGGWTVLAAAAALLLLSFKAGFVRQDAHVAIAGAALALVAGLLAAVHGGVAPFVGLAAALAGWAVFDTAAFGPEQPGWAARAAPAYAAAGHGLADRLRGGAGLRAGYDAALAQIRADYPLPPLVGSSDIYSSGQSILLAHGLAWSPRPVLQSYSAYSPGLADADADHLRQGSAPDNVLVALEPIDGRLPALEDGPSWLPLLAGYRATALLGPMAVLRRSPGDGDSGVLGPATPPAAHTLGETVPLPPGAGPVWATIDVQPTVLGRLLAAAFKPPPLRIAMHMPDGKTYDFRYVAGMGRAGFMISPLVADAARLLALQLPDAAMFGDDRPVSFTLAGDVRYWQAAFTIRFAPVRLPPRPGVAAVLFHGPEAVPPPQDTASRCSLDTADGRVVDHAAPLALAGLVRLNGWGFGGAGVGVTPQSIAVTLRGGDGTLAAFPALFQDRPDVGEHFDQPALSHIGFQALMDLRGLHGVFDMGLLLEAGGHRWACALDGGVTVTPGP